MKPKNRVASAARPLHMYIHMYMHSPPAGHLHTAPVFCSSRRFA